MDSSQKNSSDKKTQARATVEPVTKPRRGRPPKGPQSLDGKRRTVRFSKGDDVLIDGVLEEAGTSQKAAEFSDYIRPTVIKLFKKAKGKR